MRLLTRRLLIVAGILLAIVIVRLTLFRPDPIAVTAHTIDRGRVEETAVNSRAGTVDSRLRAEMSPGLAGLVTEISVRKGQSVRRGQKLLLLDDREYRAQATLAARSLDAARAGAQEACLVAAQADRDRTRAETLALQGLLSDQQLEEARTRAEGAEAGCLAARERIRQAEAALAAAEATLAKTILSAPFDGTVLDVTTEVGEWISPSPPGVFIPAVIDLINPDSLYVAAPIDEADVARIRAGMPARITMDAFRGKAFPARLTFVSSFVETRQEQNRTLTVEAVFNDDDLPENLLPGLSADIEVILDARDDVLRIPTFALLEGDRVLIVRSGKLESVSVQVGIRNWEYAEIRGGLSEGDRVVTSLDRPEVKAGARVRVSDQASR